MRGMYHPHDEQCRKRSLIRAKEHIRTTEQIRDSPGSVVAQVVKLETHEPSQQRSGKLIGQLQMSNRQEKSRTKRICYRGTIGHMLEDGTQLPSAHMKAPVPQPAS